MNICRNPSYLFNEARASIIHSKNKIQYLLSHENAIPFHSFSVCSSFLPPSPTQHAQQMSFVIFIPCPSTLPLFTNLPVILETTSSLDTTHVKVTMGLLTRCIKTDPPTCQGTQACAVRKSMPPLGYARINIGVNTVTDPQLIPKKSINIFIFAQGGHALLGGCERQTIKARKKH